MMTDESQIKESNSRDEREKKIFAWLDSHWTTQKICPICQHKKWNVSVDTGIISVAKNQSIQFNETYPFILISCTNCGYTFLLNEVIMGLTKPLDPKKDNNEKKVDGT
jgi:predicted nucleic-acid-binding Zn-ribbon protein